MRSGKIKPRKSKVPLYKIYDGLNPQQMQFVEYLLADKAMNITEAARQAGYKTPSQSANALMKNEKVSKAISQALHQRMVVTGVKKERVIYELACIAFSNIQDFVDENGNPIPVQDLPDHVARALKRIKVSHKIDDDSEDATETVEWDAYSKLEALKLLAPHVGLETTPDVNINVGSGFDFDALWRAANDDSTEDLVEKRLIEESKKNERVEPEILEVPYTIEDFNEEGDE